MITRRSLRKTILLTAIPLWFACAKTEGGDLNGDGDGDGDGDGGTSTGGVIISNTGGATSTGGIAATGGDNALGGAGPTTGGTTASGGTTFEGACADYGPVSGVNTTGDFGIHTCTEDRDGCLGVTLNEPALFECISDHANNCTTQTPQQGSAWQFVELCSELGMGGATVN